MLRWSRLLCTLLLVTKYGVVRSLKCPTSASDWDRASRSLQCQLPNYYHCLRDESGAHTEQCLPRVWIQSEMCPEFNPRVSRIDVYRCSVANCPTSLYWSNAVFMYPICYKSGSLISPTKQGPIVTTAILDNISTFTTTFGSLEYNGDEPSTDTLPLAAIVGIILGVIMICLVGVLIILLVYKKRHKETGNASNMESGKNNQKFSEAQAEENEISEVNKLLDEHKIVKESIQANKLLDSENDKKYNESETERSQDNEKPTDTKDRCQGYQCPLESKESMKDRCQVYVVENRKRKEQKSVKKTEHSVRVLVLLLNKPISVLEINSEARKMFGPNYDYCWTVSYYQKHKQEESASLFAQNFDLHNVSAKEIFERICDVVIKTKVDVNFVITVPFNIWMNQRNDLAPFINEDKNLPFENVYW